MIRTTSETSLEINHLEVFSMRKKDFVTLIMSTIGGILFALGMCMALLPEWGAMTQGIVMGGGWPGRAAGHAPGAPQDGRQARHRL